MTTVTVGVKTSRSLPADVPAARNMKGFQRGYFLVDRKTGKGMSVALWDTENDMRASEEAVDRLRAQIATASGAQIVSVERYEVAVVAEQIPTRRPRLARVLSWSKAPEGAFFLPAS